MKIDGKSYRTIWRAGPAAVEIIDQTRLPHEFDVPPHRHARRRRRGDQDDGGARRAADRRHRRLWPRPRAAQGRPTTPALDAAYRALDASRPTAVNLRHALDDVRSRRRAAAAAGARRGGVRARRRDLRGGRRAQPRHRRGRASLIEAAHERTGPPGQRADPLQRRLARDGRLGHRDRADLSRPRPRRAGPCLGRRDAAAQPGRLAHRLRTRPARRAAHADRRQRRRPSDAAWQGRPLHRRRRPRHRARRRRQQDRHLPQGAGRPRKRRAVLRRRARHDDRLDDRRRPRHRDRGAQTRARSPISGAASPTGGRVEVELAPPGTRAANPAFDVTPGRTGRAASSPSAGFRRRPRRRWRRSTAAAEAAALTAARPLRYLQPR